MGKTGRRIGRLVSELKTLNGGLPPRDPLAVAIPEAVRLSGLSRSELYRRMGDGRIQAVKAGTRTLVLMESLRAHLESLPRAIFHTAA